MKIVITGNIGCGKSTATRVIHRMLPDYYLFDFDHVVASLYSDEIVRMQLINAFGTADKGQISDIVHADQKAMLKLRSITDAAILTAIYSANKRVDVIFDIPLYFEFNDLMRLNPDAVICVTADEASQIERVKARSGFSEEKIRSIIAKQLPQDEKVARSDYLLHNDAPSAEVFEQDVAEFIVFHQNFGFLR